MFWISKKKSSIDLKVPTEHQNLTHTHAYTHPVIGYHSNHHFTDQESTFVVFVCHFPTCQYQHPLHPDRTWCSLFKWMWFSDVHGEISSLYRSYRSWTRCSIRCAVLYLILYSFFCRFETSRKFRRFPPERRECLRVSLYLSVAHSSM